MEEGGRRGIDWIKGEQSRERDAFEILSKEGQVVRFVKFIVDCICKRAHSRQMLTL